MLHMLIFNIYIIIKGYKVSIFNILNVSHSYEEEQNLEQSLLL